MLVEMGEICLWLFIEKKRLQGQVLKNKIYYVSSEEFWEHLT